MTRRLRILVSLLLLSTVAWLAWSLFGESEPPGSLGPNAVARESAPAANVVAAEPAPELPDTRASRVAAPATTPSGSGSPPVPADATWVEILVTDKASGSPVAGAEVAWLDSTSYQLLGASAEDLQWIYRDPEPVARSHGWRALTDAKGMVRANVSHFTVVFARAGTRLGSLNCNKAMRPPQGYRIELVEDRNLQVQVLDAVARPAPGVLIAVAEHGADGAFLRLWSSGPVARTTKPDGTTRIPHMQDWQEGPPGGAAPVPAAQWRVRIEMPGSKDPGIAFDPKAPPAATVVLRLPPTGSVTARVETAGGIRIRNPTHVGLHVGSPDDQHARDRALQQPIGPDGCARFAWVPVGGTFVAFTRLNAATLYKEFAGPTTPGEEVTVVLTPSSDEVALTGRIHDDRYQLVRNAGLQADYKTTRARGSTPLQTDSEGRFALFIGMRREERVEAFVVERRSEGAPTLRAAIPPGGLEPGVHDVGDLVLQAGLLVVAGRFMEGERPYQGHVSFMIQRKQSGGGGNSRESWEQVQGLTTTQKPPGTFDVRGDTGPGQHRIAFLGWDHLPVEPVEFVPGTRDLVVQIVRGAPLVATVLLPRELPWGVQGLLKPDKPGTEPLQRDGPFEFLRLDRFRADATEEQPSGRGTLLWRVLPPGSYSLELRLWGVAEPLLTIPRVNVPLPADDHRLEDIDLRAKVAVLTVRGLDPAGKPLASADREAFLFMHPLDPAGEWFGHRLEKGAVRIAVRPGPVDLLVAAGGFRPKEVRGARGEVEVTLEAWPEIELIFPDLPELPDGYGLRAVLLGADAYPRARYTAMAGAGASSSGGGENLFRPRLADTKVQKGRLKLPIGDGPQRLAVYLYGGPGRSRELTGVTPREVSASAAPIEVRVPADVLEKALAEQKAGTGR